MKDFKRLTGRPEIDDKKSKTIRARLNEDEYSLFENMAETLGINQTELIRKKVLNNSNSIIINAKEAIKSLDAVGEELGRSGNNINQLARYANTLNKQGLQTEVISNRFNVLFEKYIDIQQKVEKALRKIVRLIGN